MPTPPEFSQRVALDRIGATALEVEVLLPPDALGPVAARLRLPAVEALRCAWRLRQAPGAPDIIEAEGRLEARVTQDCVVTLEPFDAIVTEQFSLRFVPERALTLDDDPDSPDELVHDGRALELGDATIEQLALALDPFPRSPGAVIDAVEDPPPPAGPGRPFAALAAQRKPN